MLNQTDALRQHVHRMIRQHQRQALLLRQSLRAERWAERRIRAAEVAMSRRFKIELHRVQMRCRHDFLPWEPVEKDNGVSLQEERRCRCCMKREVQPLQLQEAANDSDSALGV